jgi:hypothetical protein
MNGPILSLLNRWFQSGTIGILSGNRLPAVAAVFPIPLQVFVRSAETFPLVLEFVK